MNRSITKISAGAAALVIAAGTGAATYAALPDENGTTTIVPHSSAPGGSAQTVKDGALTIGEVYERANPSAVEITVTTTASQAKGPDRIGLVPGAGHRLRLRHAGHWSRTPTSSRVPPPSRSRSRTARPTRDGRRRRRFDRPRGAPGRRPASVLHPLPLADSDELAVGDGVVAIGSPFGLENTSRPASSARSAARSSRRTDARSAARSRPTPRSTTGTRAARCWTSRPGDRRQRPDRERVRRQRRRRVRDPVEHREVDRRAARRGRQRPARVPRRLRRPVAGTAGATLERCAPTPPPPRPGSGRRRRHRGRRPGDPVDRRAADRDRLAQAGRPRHRGLSPERREATA